MTDNRTDDPPVLRLSEVSERTGLNPSTIRAWERRHSAVDPGRTDGGHRLYRQSDVQRLLRIKALVDRGWAVPKAADHVRDQDLPQLRPAPTSGIDSVGLEAALVAIRAIVRAESPTAATAALTDFVRSVGGEVVPPRLQDDHVLPVDLSLGEGEPLIPAAEPFSLARLRLEFYLPELVADARRIAALLRAARQPPATH